MFSKILSLFGSVFSKSKLGVLFSIIFAKATSTVVKEIMDKENQRVAYEFVKALNDRKDITNSEKAKLFNKKMLEWAGMMGKKISESVINCLRELAVNALKCEKEG